MHFVKFLIGVVCFQLLYWHLIHLIISLPSFMFMPAIVWASEGKKTLLKKILLVPVFIGGFLFGTLIPVMFFSAGIFGIANYFSQAASHPWLYVIIGGLFCFWIAAPSGETSSIAMLISLISYILYNTIFHTLGQKIYNIGDLIIDWFLAISIPILVIGAIVFVAIKFEEWNRGSKK